MAKRRRGSANRRIKERGKRPWLAAAVVILIIVAAFFLLEKAKRSTPEKVVEPPQAGVRQKMPPRAGAPAGQDAYTTASAPSLQPAGSPARKRATGPGSLAIIVDDMGSSMQEARSLLAIDVPITFSIIPGLAREREVAELARSRGGEVMIHIPMEPKEYPKRRLEANGLLTTQSAAEMERRVSGYLQDIPYAVGVNNHMGSRFTEEGEKMRTVLKILKGKGLFFIDSRTTPASTGYSLAREMGIRTATRDVFLDNVQDEGYIKGQLDQAANAARRRGSAIAICHPHPATLRALAKYLPLLQGDGITFVHASELVR